MSYKRMTMIVLSCLLLLMAGVPLMAQDDASDDYTIPELPEGADPETVIAVVGDTEITLGDYFERIRFERFYRLNFLETFATQQPGDIFNLEDPQNQFASQIVNFLGPIASTQNFAETVYDTLIFDALYGQEFEARGIELDQCEVDQVYAAFLSIQQDPSGDPCVFPEDFEEQKASFIEGATIYTGMTAEDVENTMRSQVSVGVVIDAFAEDIELPDATTFITTQIRVADEAAAEDVLARLDEGEAWIEVLFEVSEDPNIRGNGGELPPLSRGDTVPEFDEAIFTNPVGELIAPVQTQFGFHIIEVLEETTGISVSQIVLANQEDADTAYTLITEDDVPLADLAQEFSLDTASAFNNGVIGFVTEESSPLSPELTERVLAAEPGTVFEPVETQQGFVVYQVGEASEEPVQVLARHILVEDEAFAQELFDRIAAGEDFALLADQYSIDSRGNRGDTLAVFSANQQTGAYTQAQIETIAPEFAEALEGAEEGAVLGPLSANEGVYLLRVEEVGSRPPSQQEIDAAVQAAVQEWEQEQIETIEETTIWREFLIDDPMPSAISDTMAPLDDLVEQIAVQQEEARIANSIPNVLSVLEVEEPEPAEEAEPEATPEAESSEDDAEATPEAESDDDEAEATEEAGDE